jgi:hypothetical protein
VALTADIYSHVIGEMQREAADRLDAVFSKRALGENI